MGRSPLTHLDEAELRRLAGAGHVADFPADTVLFRKGEPGDSMYLVDEGSVQILFEHGKPAKTLGPGEYFGELALLTGGMPRSATAIAVAGSRLRVLDRSAVDSLASSNPRLLCALLRDTCAYLVDSENGLITSLQQRNAELERALDYLRRTREELDASELAAQTDVMTGLYNRRCFDEQLHKFLARAGSGPGRLALVLIDLDEFKPINDTHGHPAGDDVLKGLSAVLASEVRSTDLPCRIGGDEFALLLPGVEPEQARELAGAIHDQIGALVVQSQDLLKKPLRLRITASMGCAIHCPGESAEDLVKRADQAVYRAKHGGRNRLEWAAEPDGD